MANFTEFLETQYLMNTLYYIVFRNFLLNGRIKKESLCKIWLSQYFVEMIRKVLEETPETCVYGLEVEPGYQPNKVSVH